jgi:hypothetical protein
LPGLTFSLVPLTPAGDLPLRREGGGVRLHGQLIFVEPPSFSFQDGVACDLEAVLDARGVRLTGILQLDVPSLLAFIPHLPGQHPLDASWRNHFGSWGLVAFPLPASPVTPEGRREPMRVDVLLRAQEAHVYINSVSGRPALRGRAEIGYFIQRESAPPPAETTA